MSSQKAESSSDPRSGSSPTPGAQTPFAKAAKTVRRRIVGAGKSLVRAGKQRFTVMLIPHSERRVLNFQLNTFALAFLALVIALVLGGFFYLSTTFTGTARTAENRAEALEEADASLDSIRTELGELSKVSDVFVGALTETLSTLGIGPEGDTGTPSQTGDMSSFLEVQEIAEGELSEIYELQDLIATLRGATGFMSEMREVLEAQRQFLSDIPNMWPVPNSFRVTMEWGPNIHPIHGGWYMHKGIDIRGDLNMSVVASANGKVIETGYEPVGYGTYVVLQHRYGFRTKYSHLHALTVAEGDDVVQGQRIGTLGSSGMTTGPHLDFIIWLGENVVDPAAYLKITNSWSRDMAIRRNRTVTGTPYGN